MGKQASAACPTCGMSRGPGSGQRQRPAPLRRRNWPRRYRHWRTRPLLLHIWLACILHKGTVYIVLHAISITSPSSSSLSSSCKVPWWCTPTADDQWRFLVLLTYSCQTLIPLCLENARKNIPAWPAARTFMLIISAFPVASPSFLSEVENGFPQGCHIISESGLTCNFTHISIAIDWVFFFFSKNTKTEW